MQTAPANQDSTWRNSAAGNPKGKVLRTKLFSLVAAFVIFLAVTVALQQQAGSFEAEFSSYPDEPAHYVTGLMVTEYLRQGFPATPVRFAEEYYLHYPKVALGHWPPVFYAVQAFWCLLFSSSKVSVLMLNACLTSLTAVLLFAQVRKAAPFFPALCLSMVYVLLPVSQQGTQALMAEPLLSLLSFLAVIYFARFWENGRIHNACLFGLWTGLAILTKGSGVALLLIPAFAIAATRRWSMATNPALLCGLAIAGILGAPWTAATMHISSGGWATSTVAEYAFYALWQAPLLSFREMGLAFGVLFLVSIWGLFSSAQWSEPLFLACLAEFAAVVLFHIFLPVGLEARRFHAAIPEALFICVYGLKRFAEWRPSIPISVPAALALVIVSFSSLPATPKPRRAYGRSAEFVLSSADRKGCVVMIASDVMGEGQFIAETALRRHKPDLFILRGSKQLAASRWSGVNYKLRYQDVDAVARYIEELPVTMIVTDDYPETGQLPHNQLMKQFLEREKASWEVVQKIESTADGRLSHIDVYRNRTKTCQSNPHVEVDLSEKLNRILKMN